MALTEHTREQIDYVLLPGDAFSVVRTTPEFLRNFAIESETDTRIDVVHRSGARVQVSLDGKGDITGHVVHAPGETPWPDARDARPTLPLRARSWGEVWATVRADLQTIVETVEGEEIAVLGEDAHGRWRWRFILEDRDNGDPLYLGEGKSACTDPVSWTLLALKLERDLPMDGATAVADLRLAVEALRQVLPFVEGDRVPESVVGPVGKSLEERRPGLFHEPRIRAAIGRLSTRADVIEHVDGRDPTLHLGAAVFKLEQVPSTTEHFGPAILNHILAVAMDASNHLREAESVLPDDDGLARRREWLDAHLRSTLEASQAVPALGPFERVMVSPQSLDVPEDYTPPAVGGAPEPGPGWHQVDGDDSGSLWRHDQGGALRLVMADGVVGIAQLYTDGPALAELSTVGHTLIDAQRQTLLAHLQEGANPRQTLAPLDAQPTWQLRPFVTGNAGEGRRFRTWIVDAFEPRRSALLMVIVDAEDAQLGHILLQGPAAVDQMLRFAVAQQPAPPPLSVTGAAGDLVALVRAGASAVLALRPSDADIETVFTSRAVPHIKANIGQFWVDPLDLPAGDHQVRTFEARTQEFAAEQGDAAEFPGGWAMVAAHLRRDVVWHHVVLRDADNRTRHLTGFVWLHDHWAWFPKPWRLLPEGMLET